MFIETINQSQVADVKYNVENPLDIAKLIIDLIRAEPPEHHKKHTAQQLSKMLLG